MMRSVPFHRALPVALGTVLLGVCPAGGVRADEPGRSAAAVSAGAEEGQGASDREGASDRVVHGTIVGRANQQRVVTSRLIAPVRPVRPGQAAALSLVVEMKKGWHVNSSRPTLEYLIPTRVEFPETGKFDVEDIWYPDGIMVDLEFAEERLSVYEGRTTIRPTLRAPRDAAHGEEPVVARLTYQACSHKACLAPETVEFRIPLAIAGEPVAAGSGIAPVGERGDRSSGPAIGSAVVGGEALETLLSERGLLVVLGFVFLGGLALNLTPCVYPMIPVTVGFFGNQSAGGGWGRRIGLPAIYVFGMALTYSALGVAAGLSGGLFGATLQSPWMIGFLVVLFVALALWMFGVYELRLPGALTRLGGGRTGAIGALLMGLTMGIVAAPCIGPFVVGLLVFVSASGDPYLGFLMFFVMALGLGVPFLVLGTFSGALATLPRSGVWLIYSKKIMGVALLAVALYFLQPFLTDRQVGFLALLFALGSGLYLGWLERSRMAAPWFPAVKVAVGALVIACGAWLALPLLAGHAEADWRDYTAAGLERAREEGRPAIIDLFAEWCFPCKELDRRTFGDPRVIEHLDRFALFKADLTSFESEPVRELREQFQVIGVPTIIFIDADGAEQVDLRLHGFEPPERFIERLAQVR